MHNLPLFFSTKCEKSVSSDTNASSEMASEREKACLKVSDRLSGSSSRGCTAGKVQCLCLGWRKQNFSCFDWTLVSCSHWWLTSIRRHDLGTSGCAEPGGRDRVSSEEERTGALPQTEKVHSVFCLFHQRLRRPEWNCTVMAGSASLDFVCFLAKGGYRTGVASGWKTRTWSLIQTRRSLLHLLLYLQVTERTKKVVLSHSGTFRCLSMTSAGLHELPP